MALATSADGWLFHGRRDQRRPLSGAGS